MTTPVVSNHQTEEQRQATLEELDKLDPNEIDPDEDDSDQSDDSDSDDQADDDSDAGDDDDQSDSDDKNGEEEDSSDDDSGDAKDDEEDATDADKTDKKPVDKSDKSDPDYKEKFRHSTDEAQVLALRNKTYQEKIDAAENLADPTDEQCRAEWGEAWDKKDDADKSILRQVLKDRQYKEIIRSARQEEKEAQQFYEAANTFAITPDNVKRFPALDGREAEFSKFASKASRRGLELEDIAAIFTTSRPPKKKASAGSMMERSNANTDKSKPVKKSYSADQASTLRKVDPKAYQKAIRSGKINPSTMID